MSVDTRLRASTADGVVLSGRLLQLHMPRTEVAKFTVQRALFALSDASKLKLFGGEIPRPTIADRILKDRRRAITSVNMSRGSGQSCFAL